MNRIILTEKNIPMVRYYNGELFARFNIETEFKEETKFKNSAFVKTGRKIPTGNYTAYEHLVNFGKFSNLSFYGFESKVMASIDKYVKNQILYGFVWNGYRAWLSQENQQNYASWHSILQTNPEILPLKAKFNSAKNNAEVYYDFGSVEEFNDFYSKSIKHINDTVNFGRSLKEYFYTNKEIYKNDLNKLLRGEL